MQDFNSTIELHDSVLDTLTIAGGAARVGLRACVHQSESRPGIDNGSVVFQFAVLEFAQAKLLGAVGDLPSRVFDGSFRLADEVFDNEVRLPCEFSLAASLTLLLSPDNRELQILGTAVKVVMVGESKYVEEFPGHTA